MASFVDDLLRDAQAAGRSVSNAAASLLHTAQEQTGQLFGFANGKLNGPLAAKYGSDPVVFFHNVVKKDVGFWTNVTNDVAARSGRSTYRVTDPGTGKAGDVPAITKTSAPFNVIAMTVCLAAVNNPALFVDAAGRRASGVGGGRGVDDVYWWPGSMAVAQGAGAGPGRGVFGADDLAAIAGIATAIAAIAGVILPVLVSAVGFVVKVVGPALVPKQDAPPPSPPDQVAGIPIPLILVGVAALIAVVLLWKPKAAG